MSNYTYEAKETDRKLETYEWDNVWWEQTERVNADRVLYIGDSISCGIRRKATEVSQNTLLFDGFGSSKALDNPYLLDSIAIFAKQQGSRRAVLFNSGLHGWHLDDETEYATYYETALCFLIEKFPNTPIIPVLTTHVIDEAREARVKARNAVVLRLAEKYGLPVFDLYALSLAYADKITDGVHFAPEAYVAFGKEMVAFVSAIIGDATK